MQCGDITLWNVICKIPYYLHSINCIYYFMVFYTTSFQSFKRIRQWRGAVTIIMLASFTLCSPLC